MCLAMVQVRKELLQRSQKRGGLQNDAFSTEYTGGAELKATGLSDYAVISVVIYRPVRQQQPES